MITLRLTLLAGIAVASCALLAGSLYVIQQVGSRQAIQRADATVSDSSITPLDSPLTPASAPQLNVTHAPGWPAVVLRNPIAPNKFGIEVDAAYSDLVGARVIESAGFSWLRHIHVSWADLEPTYGVYTMTPVIVGGRPITYTNWYQDLDAGIARASATGIRPILLIRDSPAWATVSAIRGCDSVLPGMYAHLADFVNRVVSKYEQPPYNVQYYELWNEPDMPAPHSDMYVGCWDSATNYASMLKTVYSAVKAAHPNVSILNGGLARLETWARDFIVTGTNYIDVLAYHAYDEFDQGDTMWNRATESRPAYYLQKLDTLRGWINLYNPSKSTIGIFMDEGALKWGNPHPAVSDLQRVQAYFVAFMAAEVTGEDLEQYSWWRSVPCLELSCNFHTEYGSSTGSSYMTNTVYTAFAFALNQVNQARHVITTRNPSGASIIKLTDANGKELWLMWNTDGSNSAPFVCHFNPAPYKVWDVWGRPAALTNNGSDLYMADPYKVVWVQPYQ